MSTTAAPSALQLPNQGQAPGPERERPDSPGPVATPGQVEAAANIRPHGPTARQRRLLFGVVAAATSVTLAALAGAVVVPMVARQDEQEALAATGIRFPSNVAGHPRDTGAQAEQILRKMAGTGLPATSFAVYGGQEAGRLVLMARKPTDPLSPAEQLAGMATLADTYAKVLGANLRLEAQDDAGPLGGYLACGSDSRLSMCLAVGRTSQFALLAGADFETDIGLAGLTRQARAATVDQPG